MSASPTSAVIVRLPQFTFAAPWPLPYAPLTTIYTPPSQCNDKWTLVSEGTDPKTTTIGQFIDLLDTEDATCLPPGYGSDVWSATFSPGVYCPSGYAIAATGKEVHTAVWEKGIKFSPDERRVVCCLSGFGYTMIGDNDACVSPYDHSTFVLTKDYLTESNQFMYTQTTEVGSGIAIGHPIHLRHNDAEFKSLFTGIPTDVASSRSSSSKISTGAIAGIAAGCGVVGLGVLGLGVWFILRHRKRKQNNPPQQPKSDEGSIEMAYPDPPTPSMGGWVSKETETTATATAAPGWDTYEQEPQAAGPSSKTSSKKKSSRSKRDRSERGERSDRHERSGRSRRHAS